MLGDASCKVDLSDSNLAGDGYTSTSANSSFSSSPSVCTYRILPRAPLQRKVCVMALERTCSHWVSMSPQTSPTTQGALETPTTTFLGSTFMAPSLRPINLTIPTPLLSIEAISAYHQGFLSVEVRME